jgi:hypothetical protein
MITVQDLYNIVGNKISNEMQKTIIRNGFPPQIAERICAVIDGQEKADHLRRMLEEWNEYQIRQQQVIQQFLGQYYK